MYRTVHEHRTARHAHVLERSCSAALFIKHRSAGAARLPDLLRCSYKKKRKLDSDMSEPSTTTGEAEAAQPTAQFGGKAPESTDYANYFCTYAYLYHQKDMLEDHKRTGAYYNAVIQNRRQFQGRVVLDVGTGSGILAIFAAMAGAKKVYAVEATSMANQARKLVAANKLSSVVEVIQGTVETVVLPEKVDIIISEWMGYFLLRESMLDSVLLARDRFLKPGGAMYPSHARMFLAPVHSQAQAQRVQDFHGSMEGWAQFTEEMHNYYNVDMSCLSESYRKEQRDYYLRTAQWVDVHPSQLVGTPVPFASMDLLKTTVEELKLGLKAELDMHIVAPGPVEAFCGWFDVAFKGSPESPTDQEVWLSTAPDPTGSTHWGQQCFYIHPALDCAVGDKIKATIEVQRQRENHRLLLVDLAVGLEGPSAYAKQMANAAPRQLHFRIE